MKSAWVSACGWVLPRRTTLHLTSACEARESAGQLAEAQCVVVPNGVDIPKAARRDGPGGEPRVLYLGRLDPIKGIDRLLEAIARTPWQLVVAGGGAPAYVRELRAQAERSGLNGRVSWLGEVGDAEKRRLFEEASVVVVPSHRENFGMVVAEALAHGVPVIAARGTPWERLEERRCGLWVANDPENLAAALLRVRDLPLAAMGERGRAWMKEEFGWPAIAQRMLDLYRACARSQSTGSATPIARGNGSSSTTARVDSRSAGS